VRSEGTEGGEARSTICAHVVDFIRPIVERWGVSIVNFQLESIKLQDISYANEYQSASLALAKAEADLRALAAQNKVLLQKASAEADALRIKAGGQKLARIVQAEAEAEAIKIKAMADADARQIEALSRNKAADSLPNLFGQRLAIGQQQIDATASLKATTLMILPNSDIARTVVGSVASRSISDT
jgi:regulator of protease activity HflC (stomatin/prohibitin superfamily)